MLVLGRCWVLFRRCAEVVVAVVIVGCKGKQGGEAGRPSIATDTGTATVYFLLLVNRELCFW
jgi:hypothetical protein